MTKNIIFSAVYVVIVLCIYILAILKPDYNWDVLPYVASAYSLESDDTVSIHQNTYEIVKNTLPEQAYLLLVSNNRYREEMFNCARCFFQQLPFYRIRPLYVVMIYLLYKLNLNIALSPFIVSSVSCLLISIICFLWLKLVCKNITLAFIISILLAISPFLLSSATEASPNAFSALIVMTALFFFAKEKFNIFFVLMLLSLLARPDNLLLAILFSLAFILFKGKDMHVKKVYILTIMVIALILFYLVDKWSGNYNWSVWFEHSFKDRIISPAEYTAHFGLGVYLRSFLKWAILFKFTNIGLQLIVLILFFYIKHVPLKEIRNDLELIILLAAALSIPLHYIIYPVIDDKYFIAQYLFIDIIFIKTLVEKRYQSLLITG